MFKFFNVDSFVIMIDMYDIESRWLAAYLNDVISNRVESSESFISFQNVEDSMSLGYSAISKQANYSLIFSQHPMLAMRRQASSDVLQLQASFWPRVFHGQHYNIILDLVFQNKNR